MQPTRRRTLRALGVAATASAAGCLSGDRDETPTDGETSANGDESGPGAGAGDVTVRSVSVRPELVMRNSPDSYGTYGGRTSQWAVAEVAVETPDDHPPASFVVEGGGEVHRAVTDVGGGTASWRSSATPTAAGARLRAGSPPASRNPSRRSRRR